MLFLSFLAPILQLVLLGYAATFDIRSIPVAVYDRDQSRASRELVEEFTTSGYFVLAANLANADEADKLLEEGAAWLAILIPGNFSEKVARGEAAEVQILIDGSDATTATTSIGYATEILGAASRSIVTRVIERNPGLRRPPRVEAEVRVWYNPELKSRNFMVPGVVAMVLMIVTMTLTSLGIVKEKEAGTLDQLLVTPIKPYQLIIGKLLPFVLIGAIDVTLVLAVARFWFEVPLQGSILLLYALSGLFVLTTLGLGLFVSTISRTQQQAMMTAQFFILMPFIFLSGFAFPIENMPQIIQYVTYALPLRYFIEIIRGIFLKGSGIAELWPEATALAGFGIATLTLSVLRFRRRLG